MLMLQNFIESRQKRPIRPSQIMPKNFQKDMFSSFLVPRPASFTLVADGL